ncbi:unnamed protein product [Knipowitschia caucasica]
MLTQEDVSEERVDTNDEVETLQNSFLEAVHDDNIQPKMQCLMMDSSFSMVTMQGEDSGIEWETTPSRCNTPWASEAGPLSADLSTITATSPAPPGTSSAGKIIFVMDEDLISKQKKAKEKGQKPKGKGAIQPIIIGSSDNISGRPELVGFSEPNVQAETDEHVETDGYPNNDKEQKLFRLVSEGSEILNIIVPSKVVTVDEEESKEIEDNLSYLMSSTVVKANIDFSDQVFEWQNEGLPTPVSSVSAVRPPTTDPPGAPVPKTPSKQSANLDYFDAFALIEAHAPGGPAVPEQEHDKPDKANRDTEQLAKTSSHTALTTDEEHADNISLLEMTSELLDDVFYGNTDNYSKTSEKARDFKRVPSRLSSKLSGATLFGSQEDILTPIYLPEGPPKIIDQILLEEPKAMAFLYTDLYEEAIGSRKKEEDTESMSSEKSFHSRHSDREARGYLEKYVLIDETPVVGIEEKQNVQCPKDTPRTISQNVYEFDTMVTKPPKENNVITSEEEEEVTDFFRSSANSSPCFSEPLSRTAEEEEDETTTKDKTKTNKKHVVIVAETAQEQSSDSLTEFPLDDPDWESAFEDVISASGKEEVAQTLQHVDMPSSVGPAQQKAASLQKVSLDLAPLTPVDVQEEMEACAKEEREEEKETASPTETADEGDGDETNKTCSEPAPAQNTAAFDETIDTCNKPETKTISESGSQIENAAFEENSGTLEASMTKEIESSEEMQKASTAVPHVEVKEAGKCTIL